MSGRKGDAARTGAAAGGAGRGAMLDARLRKLIDPPLDALGRGLAGRGVSANSVTWTAFLVGCGAWALLALGSFGWALALILLNRLGDGLDGAVARHARMSDLGGYQIGRAHV